MKRQVDRVLAAARSFRGTCQADWLADVTPDGGPRITRVAARIDDLERQGAVFECIGKRGRTKVYRLVSEPADTPAAPPPSPPKLTPQPAPMDESRLFDLPPATVGFADQERAA